MSNWLSDSKQQVKARERELNTAHANAQKTQRQLEQERQKFIASCDRLIVPILKDVGKHLVQPPLSLFLIPRPPGYTVIKESNNDDASWKLHVGSIMQNYNRLIDVDITMHQQSASIRKISANFATTVDLHEPDCLKPYLYQEENPGDIKQSLERIKAGIKAHIIEHAVRRVYFRYLNKEGTWVIEYGAVNNPMFGVIKPSFLGW